MLLALAAGWLLASPAGAFPVLFDGPGGYGISQTSADDAFEAGFARLEPPIHQASAFGITIPDPVVLSAALKDSPSPSDPITAISTWTVQNGNRGLQNAWLVFLRPLTYEPPQVGIDLQTGEWAIVEVYLGDGEDSSAYFYPAVRLGHVAAGGSAHFQMHHVVGTELTREGDTLFLPKYGVGVLGSVPEPGPLGLFGALLAGLLLRRRSTA